MLHPINNLPGLMSVAMTQFRSWPSVLKNVNSASTSSKPFSVTDLGKYQQVERALQAESKHRESLFRKGLERYQHSPLSGPQVSAPTSILEGKHCNLRFYLSANRQKAEARPLMLCIPSLINKYYILDLTPQSSLVRHLNAEGWDVVLVEWHAPKAEDTEMGVEDYVLALMETLQIHWDYLDRPLLVLGYCLGGMVATALACLFERISGLLLLATPWNFSHYAFAKMQDDQRESFQKQVESSALFASEKVQSLCYLANAGRVVSQFSRFADGQYHRTHQEEKNFVAIQHWANDGVDITRKVAQQCLINWPQQNAPYKGEWKVDGYPIRPRELTLPVFAAVPTRDNIVPYECAIGLVDRMQDVTLITPSSGHVGMVAGLKQRERMLLPLERWLAEF